MPATATTPRAVRLDTLRYWMRRRGLTQQALADAVGVTQPAVSGWLSGKTATMDFGTGLAVAETLGIAPAALVHPPPVE